MAASYQDTFSGSGALGTIEIGGVAWSAISGSWSRSNGFATTSTAGTSNPIAAIDVGWGDVDISAAVANGGGDCVLFRVTDASNWLRARVKADQGSVTYGPWIDQGRLTLSPGDDAYHNPAFFNRTVTTETTMEVYDSTASSFEFYIRSKSVSYSFTVVVEKCVAGTITSIGSSPSSATPVTAVRVVAAGSTITLYINGASTNSGTFVDATAATATKHGVGRGPTNALDRSGLDNFALTPLNRAPNAPALVFPAGGVQLDSTVAQRFSWTFSDPDPGDSQSKATVYYRQVGTTDWTSVTDITANGWHDFAGDTFTPGDYEWQAETYDAAGHLGARSASSFFTVATPPAGPTWLSPINGATISAATQVFQWSAADQDSYQVRRVADDGSGNPDTATVYFDSDEVVDAAARATTLTFETNSRTEHVQIRVKVSGLWSDWTDSTHPVSYTAPARPVVTVTADDDTASITISVAQPTPSGSQPAVVSTDIYRRIVDATTGLATGDPIRVATDLAANVDWTDWTAASSTAYQYQAVAVAANQTSTASRWSPGGGSGLPGNQGVYDESTYDNAVYS